MGGELNLLSISLSRSEEGALSGESRTLFQSRMSQTLSSPSLCLPHLPASASRPSHQEDFCVLPGLAQALLVRGQGGEKTEAARGLLPRPRLVMRRQEQQKWGSA